MMNHLPTAINSLFTLAHEAAERGESLTAKSMRGIYRKLLDAYFGPKFTIDESLETECFRVPHFYRAFYAK